MNIKNMYKNVNELTESELLELRGRLYHSMMDDGSLEEVMGKKIETEEEIPLGFVKNHYEDTLFVEEDFWCNQ